MDFMKDIKNKTVDLLIEITKKVLEFITYLSAQSHQPLPSHI